MTHTSTPHLTSPIASNDRAVWTLADVAHSSSGRASAIGALTALVALVASVHTAVPWVVGLTLAALVPAALVDVMVRRLPNRLVAFGAGVWLLTFVVTALADGVPSLRGAALGVLAMAGPLLVTHLIRPSSMGFGDVKYAAVLGASVGLVAPTLALVALTVGAFLAAVHGLATRQRTIAFGPGLLAGSVITIVAVAIGIIDPADASAAVELAGRTL